MLEVLVFTACMNAVACNETSTAYYAHNAELRASVKHAEERAKLRLGQQVYTTVSTLALIGLRREYTIKLSERIALKGATGWHHYTLHYSYVF
jgi:hypothetical protein